MTYRLPHDRPNGGTAQGPQEEVHEESSRRRVVMRPIAVLPTMLTLGNLLCGFGSVFFASRAMQSPEPLRFTPLSPLTFSAMLIFVGMILDGLDGRIARLTGNISDLGEQLDSMADMVTFGVAPAFLAVQLAGVEAPFMPIVVEDQLFDRFAVVVACIYVACAALRLARFNIERAREQKSKHTSFVGLPSPAAAGTVASLVLLHQHFLADGSPTDWPSHLAAIGMVLIMLLAAFGMVSRLRYVHVANRYLGGGARFGTVTKLVMLALLMLVWLQEAMAAGFALYALSGPGQWLWQRFGVQRAKNE